MRIYQDLFSDVDILSDSYKFIYFEQFGSVAFEVKTSMVVKGEQEVDVGCGNAFGGAQEEEGGQGGAPPEKVNDLIDTFHYQETAFTKDQFKAYFKEYMKKLLEQVIQKKHTDEAKIKQWKENMTNLFKWLLKTFDEFTFYTNQQFDTENHVMMSYYKDEEDEAPHFVFFVDGLKSYKV